MLARGALQREGRLRTKSCRVPLLRRSLPTALVQRSRGEPPALLVAVKAFSKFSCRRHTIHVTHMVRGIDGA